MTTQTKFSHSGKLSSRRSKRSLIQWGVGLLLVAVLVGLFLAWHYRYHLLEHKVRQILVQNGFETSLEIRRADTRKAVIENVKLLSGGKQVFASRRIELKYEYAGAIAGEFDRIVIHNPTLAVTLDRSGKIVDDWLPKSSGGAGVVFPKNGVVIEDAIVGWHAPFGHGETTLNVDAKSVHNWHVVYNSPDTVFTKDDVAIQVNVNGEAKQEEQNQMTAFGSLFSKSLVTPAVSLDNGKVEYHLDFNRKNSNEINVLGWVNIGGSRVNTSKLTARTVDLKLGMDSNFNPKTNIFDMFAAHWELKSDNVVLKNQAARQQIAERVTARQALQNIPIAQQFSGIIPKKLEALLSDFSLQGEGDLTVNQDGYRVKVTDVLKVTNPHQIVEISANTRDVLAYMARDEKMIFDMDVNWSGAHALRIQGLKAQGSSTNGLSLQSINRLQAKLHTNANWYGQGGQKTSRLAPLSIGLDYVQNDGVRDITLAGKLEYDGVVPGGMVDGLLAEGVLTTHIVQDASRDFHVGFVPKKDIYMKSFAGASGWQAQGLQFTLTPTETLLRTTIQGREMLADLQNVHAEIINPAQDRQMQVEAKHVQVQTYINDLPRIWNLDVRDAVVRSENFPSPGTHIRSKFSQLVLQQNKNGSLYFASKNPATFIETDNVRIDSIDVEMSGSPEKFEAMYVAPKVMFKGGDVPALPVSGTATFNNGLLTGKAVANLKTKSRGDENTPIDISFLSQDGKGNLTINIKEMNFFPTGLQPQFLIPSLRGKLAEVSGQASAQFAVEFANGGPLRSYGTTNLIELDMGTLVGPIQGVNAELKFSSLFPLKTDGVQSAILSGFDPGFPLENGNILFEILPEGVRIVEAAWPINNDVETLLDDGRVFIDPMLWKFGNVENLATVNIENLELATLFEEVGRDKLSVTGKVSGVLPATIDGVDVQIAGGKLAVKDGGVIRFKAAAASAGAASAKNEYAGHGLMALENLTYQKMEALIDGPLDGSVKLNIVAEGYNPEVLSGQNFLFDVGVDGELANIARNLSKSFKSQENIKRVLGLQTEQPD